MDMVRTATDLDAPIAAGWSGADEPRDWLDLAHRCSEPNPFYHPALLRPALDLFDSDNRITLIEAWEKRQLIGLMPVIASARHGRYPIPNVANWMHDQCFYGAPLLCQGQEVAALSGILAQLDGVSWSGQFLHLSGLDLDGPAVNALLSCCEQEGRPIKLIAMHQRALLRSELSADAYWQANVRPKKRKEIRRLVHRLAEAGAVTHRRLRDGGDATAWAADFLGLEASGWKGREGAALAASDRTRAWFNDGIAAAAAAGMLDMLRIDVDGRAIAMLVNFRHGRGAFSYKIAFDERYARYSPGLLVEIDNLHAVLDDDVPSGALEWMDSCAAADHPMIDGLWSERRRIGQFRVALKGRGLTAMKRAVAFHATGFAERTLDFVRKGIR